MTQFNLIAIPPKVVLIGYTKPEMSGLAEVMKLRNNTWDTDIIGEDPLSLVEFGGRVCYESFDNKKNRSRLDYILDTAIDKGHGSILEHAWFNFAVLGLPRSSLMELTRHRVGTAYSWRSTRYVDNWVEYAVPPALRGSDEAIEIFKEECMKNFSSYEALKSLVKFHNPDFSKKEVIEAARSILSNAAVADGEFSVNLRELIHILKLRLDKGADASMQEFAQALYDAAHPIVGEILDHALGVSDGEQPTE